MVKRFPDDPFCQIMASMGSINGSASGEIIVHFGVFLNRKMWGGEVRDSGEAMAGIWVREGCNRNAAGREVTEKMKVKEKVAEGRVGKKGGDIDSECGKT